MKGTGKLLTSEHWQYTKNNTEIVDVGMAPDVWQACTKEAESADPSIAVLRTGASGGAHQEVRAPGLKKQPNFLKFGGIGPVRIPKPPNLLFTVSKFQKKDKSQ
jgi:hypothetical protein